MSIRWSDATTVWDEPPPTRVDWMLVKTTTRRNVTVYRPAGEWNLVIMVPMGLADDVWFAVAEPYLSAEEARTVKESISKP